MNKEEYKTIEIKIPKLNDLEIKRGINDSLYCIKEINELVIKDKQEQYIRELLNRIDKANKIIDECLLIGTYEYEIEGQLDNLKRVLGGKQ